MSNLDAVIPTVYEAMDVVSRELTGFIPAVSRDSNAQRAAKGQTISSHVVPPVTLEDITPGEAPNNSGDTNLDKVEMSISKARAAPVKWTGEEQQGVSQSGQLQAVQRDRFAQSMRALVNEMERDIATEYIRASRAYGTAGSTPFSSDITEIAELHKILADNGAPQDGESHLVFDTAAGANLRSQDKLTDVNRAGTEDTLRRGELGRIYNMALRESAGIRNHSAGSASSVTVDGAHDEGATEISVSVGDSLSLNAGDVIDFGGDNLYVVAEATSDSPVRIREPGLMAPLEGGESLSVKSNFAANLAFHRSALHLVTRAPAMPEGGDDADDVTEVTDPVTGLAFQVALYRQYRQVKYEVGLAWGWRAVKPEHMALLMG